MAKLRDVLSTECASRILSAVHNGSPQALEQVLSQHQRTVDEIISLSKGKSVTPGKNQKIP